MKFKKIINYFNNAFYLFVIQNSLRGTSSVLDVGCGSHSIIGSVKGDFTSTGIDLFRKSIELSKKAKIHDKYVIGDIRKLDSNFSKKSFDAVIALDVIEHLTRQEATNLMKNMEKIARKRVIILTPNGFYPQDSIDGNPHQVHKSGWFIKDFTKNGYKIFGLRGLKYLRGIHASIKYKPWLFWAFLAVATEPLLYVMPALSFHIFAIKDIE